MAPRVKIERIGSFKVAYVRAKSVNPEGIAEAWTRLISWLGSKRALAKTSVGGGIGVIQGRPGDRGYKYEAAWPVDGEVETARGVKIGETPEGTYAVLRHKGDLRKIEESIRVVTDEWIPNSGYEQAEGPILTLHRNSLGVRHPDKQIVDVCVPVKKAGKKK